MAVADIPADQIVNERSSYEQYLWKLAGSQFYRWDSRVDYMYRIGAHPVEGQGLPPGPPVPPIPAPFSGAQVMYLDGRFVRTVNGLPVDANGNVDIPVVSSARQITAGTGLTGGGDLTADRSFALTPAVIASLAKADAAASKSYVDTSVAAARGSAVTGHELLVNAARGGFVTAARPLVGSGDSHTDVTGGAQYLWQRMQQVGVLPGNGLEGIPAAAIVPLGNSGMTLNVYLNGGGPNTLADLLSRNPLVIVNCWLVNDVRLGALGSTVATIRAAGAALLRQLIARQRQAVPDALIVLRVPFPFTTSNSDGSNYVQAADGTVNPDGLAQTYTDGVRAAYYDAQQAHPDVMVYDPQTRLTGTTAPTSNTGSFGNQIHQSAAGYAAEADDFARWVSAQSPFQSARSTAAVAANPTAPWATYFRDVEDPSRYVRIAEGVVGTAVASGATFVDMEMVDPPVTVPNNVAAGDLIVLYSAGATLAIPQGSTIARQSGQTERIILASGTFPALPARGRVAIYRRIASTDAFVTTQMNDTSYQYKRLGRVVAGGTNYVDITAASFGTDRSVTPMSDAVTSAGVGDKVYIEGRGSTAITLATNGFSANGANLRLLAGLESGLDYSTLVGQVAVLVGTHASNFVANKISDATTVGRQVLTAADQATARNALAVPSWSSGVTAGTGLTGGGDMTVTRTLALSAASIASLAKADSAVQAAAIADIADGGRLGKISQNISGTNLNAFVVNGWGAGNNLTNSPDGSTAFFYVKNHTNTAADNYFQQIATKYAQGGNSGETWVRYAEGAGTFTSWVKITESGGAIDPVARTSAGSKYTKPGTGIPDSDLASKFVKTVNGTTPDAAGNVAVAGGGGGAVSSVNTKTGAVVLGATDVGAAAQRTIPGAVAATWTRVATIDGKSLAEGANVELLISGLGTYSANSRSTLLVQFSQQSSWTPVLKAWKWGSATDDQTGPLAFSQVSEFVTELWYFGPQYTFDASVTVLSGHNYTINLNQQAGSPNTPIFSTYISMSNPVRSVNGVTPDANGAVVAADHSHAQDVRYNAYGHSFGQVQSPVQNTTAVGVYPNRVQEMLRTDPALFTNFTQSGARSAAILTQVQSTWAQGNYGLVTLMANQNDVGDRTAEATFKANIKGILDWLRGGTPFPPTIVVVLDTTCTTAGYARYANPPTDAVVAQYNQFLRDVLAMYPTDGSIVVADPYTGWNPATMTGSDGQHPNDRGSAYIASAIRTALATTSFREGLNVGLIPPSQIFYDSFNRANSATLGTNMYGVAWTMLGSSVYGTIGSRAYRSDAGAVQESAAVVDLGKANVDLSVRVDAITTKGCGPVWRVTDINNLWVADIFGTGVGNAKVYKKVAGGAFAQVGSALTVEVKTSSIVRVVTAGSVHTIYVDGVQAWTATDAFNSTATKHGFRITDTSANANRINDVVIK